MLDLYLNIRNARKELQLTQDELAKMVGYADKSMVARVESGQIDLPYSKILSFSKALGKNPAELMGWETIHHPSPLFEQLDSIDQARIMERIETMLEADKYRDNARPAAGADPSIVASASGAASDASDSAGCSGTPAADADPQVTGESSSISSAAERKADFPERFGDNRSEQAEKRSKAAVRTSASDLDPDAAAQELRDHADRKMRLIQEKKA